MRRGRPTGDGASRSTTAQVNAPAAARASWRRSVSGDHAWSADLSNSGRRPQQTPRHTNEGQPLPDGDVGETGRRSTTSVSELGSHDWPWQALHRLPMTSRRSASPNRSTSRRRRTTNLHPQCTESISYQPPPPPSQYPEMQIMSAGHWTPHAPQLLGSEVGSTQTPPQRTSPSAHGPSPSLQAPLMQ